MHRFVAQNIAMMETRIHHAQTALAHWKNKEAAAEADNSTALDYCRRNRQGAEKQLAQAEEDLQKYKDQEGVTE